MYFFFSSRVYLLAVYVYCTTECCVFCGGTTYKSLHDNNSPQFVQTASQMILWMECLWKNKIDLFRFRTEESKNNVFYNGAP